MRRAIPNPPRLDVRGEARRAPRAAAGADPRQRSLRRDRARLGLREQLRPARGTLSIVFANVAAYGASIRPTRSHRAVSTRTSTACGPRRCSTGRGTAAELRRARECGRSTIASIICSICTRCRTCPRWPWPGGSARGSSWRRMSACRSTSLSTPVTGRPPAAGLRVLRRLGRPRSALLVECGQHWEAAAPESREAIDPALPASFRDGRGPRCSRLTSTRRPALVRR